MTFKVSKVYECQYKGKDCLETFILSREGQPHMCLHCLKELGLLEKYKPIKKKHHIYD